MMGMTATLYRRQAGQPVTWQGQALRGVFFRAASGAAFSEHGAQGGQQESLLLIPADTAEVPHPGDGVLLAEGPIENFSGDIRQHVPGCRTVTAVTARCYGSALDHWEVALR